VGIEVIAPVGAPVQRGESILRVHHRAGRGLRDGLALLDRSVEIGDAPAPGRALVVERILPFDRGN
jgi:thymidine phosphorylase